ncbi:histamine H1 receptor [Biomphalaria pfeifferi]|uniref:Histamine H1 receptor n=1 Tax=Biomphalaria pfeifferi TaxID=112525 RepID=A0AAD8CBV8_BIOPF|nr:histamine H1 receptor [Biomphalaria pfeifferi]
MDNNYTSSAHNENIYVNYTFDSTHGQLYDFSKMAAVDWDEVHDGQKLVPREYTSWNALNILRLSLSLWIMAGHLAIILFVLSKQVLRKDPKNLLIVNVALTHLVLGGFIIPVKLHFTLNPYLVDCTLAKVWIFVTEFFQTSLSLYAVAFLVFERFMYIYTEKHKTLLLMKSKKITTMVLILLPWILSLLVLLPIFQSAILVKSEDQNSCLFKVNDGFFFAAYILAFFPPSILVGTLTPFTGLLDCLRPNSCSYKPLTPKGESLTVTAFVSFCSIFSEAPYCIVRLLMLKMECNNPYCSRFSEALTMTMWIRISKAALFPFIWLAYTDIRDAVLCQIKLSDDSVDYDDENDILIEGKDIQKFPLTQPPNVPDL